MVAAVTTTTTTAAVGPTNAHATSTTTTTIRKLAPSPRDHAANLPRQQRPPFTALPSQGPGNHANLNRTDGSGGGGGGGGATTSARNHGGGGGIAKANATTGGGGAMMTTSTTTTATANPIPPPHHPGGGGGGRRPNQRMKYVKLGTGREGTSSSRDGESNLVPPPPPLLPVDIVESGPVVVGTSPSPVLLPIPPPPAAARRQANAGTAPTSPSAGNATIGGGGGDTKSKRMLVIDPRSGRKYDLRSDDHSLTDKELHVYQQSSRRRAAPPSSSSRPPPLLEEADDDGTYYDRGGEGGMGGGGADSHTLHTASALTDATTYRNDGGKDDYGRESNCRCVGASTLGDLAYHLLLGGGDDETVSAILDGAGVAGSMVSMAEEGRDDDDEQHEGDVATRGNNAPTTPTGGGEETIEYDTGMLSPISRALSTAIITPLAALSGIAGSFSFCGNHDAKTNNDDVGAAAEMRVRRVCMVVSPDEMRACLDGGGGSDGDVGLLGMKFHQCGNDFQAHVRWMQRGGKAERMGVRVGDVVSFAVALSNMTEEQNTFLAVKLIKRLEAVGMRTSYRELYDIFLSKTTNRRPIGLVFRRRANGVNAGPLSSPRTANANEFEWSTDFLQSLSIKCRECEFDQKVPFGTMFYMEEEGGINQRLASFLPPPNVDFSAGNLAVSDYLNDKLDSWKIGYNCSKTSPVMACIDSSNASPMMACIDSPFGVGSGDLLKSATANGDFLSNRVLCSLVEQSMGLIFLRRLQGEDGVTTGSGFALVRKAEGSWSAPCFVTILASKDDYVNGTNNASHPSQSEDMKMIVIRNTAMVLGLVSGTAIKLSTRKDERANVLVRDAAIIGVQEGRFQLAQDFFVAVKANEVQNQGAYSLSTGPVEASDILTGTISPPEQSVDFYGALQSLELPYSMHSHPVLPDVLQKFSDNDWVEFLPELGSGSSCGMRSKLAMIAQRDSSADVQQEIDIFARKFQYYLMDGVPVMRVLSTKSNVSMEEKVLRLTIKDPRSLFSSSLELLRRRRPGVSNVGIPSNFSTTFEAMTKLSRTPPAALSCLDDDEKKRFFSFETDLSPGPIMMLAKSKKDAMLLLCGLKLLLEREKMVFDK